MAALPAYRALDVTEDGPGRKWLSLALQRAGLPESGLPRFTENPNDEASASRTAVCTLRPEPESAKAARDFAQATLRMWALAEMGDDVAVVASELVGNAFRHGMCRAVSSVVASWIQIGLVNRGTDVLCAVTDPGTDVPVMKEPDYLAESGRGLHVVASLSGTWGWTPPDQFGKVVWAAFPTTSERDV